MAVRLSRRPGPDHPLLFRDAADIPDPPNPPRARAATDVARFRDVLEAAETEPIADIAASPAGRPVRVGGERRPADPMWGGDALIDDGEAVITAILPRGASRALRAALGARFVLISGTTCEFDGARAIEVSEIVDLRALARDWRALSRR